MAHNNDNGGNDDNGVISGHSPLSAWPSIESKSNYALHNQSGGTVAIDQFMAQFALSLSLALSSTVARPSAPLAAGSVSGV